MKTLTQNIESFTGAMFFDAVAGILFRKDFLEIEAKGSLIAKTTKDYEQLMNAVGASG